MPRHFYFDPAEYSVRPIADLRSDWRNVPDREALNLVAVEAQYLEFHRYLLIGARHRPTEGGAGIRIGLSVRAGALKSAILLSASIAEAVLRAHAEHRGYALPKRSWSRTFGRILEAWQRSNGTPRSEVAPIWTTLKALQSGRNNIHLYAALEAGGTFYDLLVAEEQTLRDADVALSTLKAMVSL